MAGFARAVATVCFIVAGLAVVGAAWVVTQVDWATLGVTPGGDAAAGAVILVLVGVALVALLFTTLGAVAWLAADVAERGGLRGVVTFPSPRDASVRH